MKYSAPAWLPGGHAQTLLPLLIKGLPPAYRRERWETPDGDFIDADWIDAAPEATAAPLFVLFHGLEGSSRSHYAITVMREVRRRGWVGVVPHFRGCSGELNRLPRAYHSGDSAEIGWILERLHAGHPERPIFAAGVSLGGNALLKWLGENGSEAPITAAAAICPPMDLAACGHNLARGFNRIYTRHFLGTLKHSAEARLARFPGLFDGARMRAARTLWDFDDAVTGPIHGFAGADDYWQRASAKPLLPSIRRPTLILSPRNDPFLPESAHPARRVLPPAVRFEAPDTGGHVGFVAGLPPGRLGWLAERLFNYFSEETPR